MNKLHTVLDEREIRNFKGIIVLNRPYLDLLAESRVNKIIALCNKSHLATLMELYTEDVFDFGDEFCLGA